MADQNPVSPAPRKTIAVTRTFAAPAESVFDAWLDAANIGRWLFATPDGKMVRVELDARVGGKFSIAEQRGDVLADHTGTYLEINRPRRLVFTFGVPLYSPEMTRVTVDITPHGPGCELTLTHEGVLPEYAVRSVAGWTGILAGLATSLIKN